MPRVSPPALMTRIMVRLRSEPPTALAMAMATATEAAGFPPPSSLAPAIRTGAMIPILTAITTIAAAAITILIPMVIMPCMARDNGSGCDKYSNDHIYIPILPGNIWQTGKALWKERLTQVKKPQKEFKI